MFKAIMCCKLDNLDVHIVSDGNMNAFLHNYGELAKHNVQFFIRTYFDEDLIDVKNLIFLEKIDNQWVVR